MANGPKLRARRFGLHHRELDVAEPHAAPFLGHVRQPESALLRCLAHLDDAVDQLLAVVAIVDALLDRAHDFVDERADAVADFFELGREAEVDGHGGSVMRREESQQATRKKRL